MGWSAPWRDGGYIPGNPVQYMKLDAFDTDGDGVIDVAKSINGLTATITELNEVPVMKTQLDQISTSVAEKTIIFTAPIVSNEALQNLEISFPYAGTVTEVLFSCSQAGIAESTFQIERCSENDYSTTPVWNDILTSELVLTGGQKLNKVSIPQNQINVQAGDYFRVKPILIDSSLKGLNVQIKIKLS